MKDVFVQQVLNSWKEILEFLPYLLAGLFILLAGGAIGVLVRNLVARALIFFGVFRALSNTSWGKSFSRGDVRHAVARFVGNVAFLLVFMFAFQMTLTVWKLELFASMIGAFVGIIPRLLLAVAIVLVGFLLARFSFRRVRDALEEEDVGSAGLLAKLVRIAIILVSLAIAMDQLQIGHGILLSAFLISFSAIAIIAVFAFLRDKKAPKDKAT